MSFANEEDALTVQSFVFGAIGDRPVPGFVLRNRHGVAMTVISYGACLTQLHLPDVRGRAADVVLGFDTLDEYIATDTYAGATCGRYGSRIRRGTFILDGRQVQVSCNEGPNHLHGGREGFDRKIWGASVDAQSNQVVFTVASPDGDEGFPGMVVASASYRLTDENVLEIVMRGQSDRPTVLNMVHHTYWNLAGHDSGDVCAHRLHLNADFYTPIDDELMTTGEVRAVAGTVFDFRAPKPIGANIDAVSNIGAGRVEAGGGYDHNWCLNAATGEHQVCARLEDPASGRAIELFTTEPGVQVYTGGYLSEKVVGKGGRRYCKYAGLTFETQRFPDAPNFGHFPSARLNPGEVYAHRMEIHLHSGA